MRYSRITLFCGIFLLVIWIGFAVVCFAAGISRPEPAGVGADTYEQAKFDRTTDNTLTTTLRLSLYASGVLIIFPGLEFVIGRTRKRKDPYGILCRGCGYDCRSTVDRCPECGIEEPTRRWAKWNTPALPRPGMPGRGAGK